MRINAIKNFHNERKFTFCKVTEDYKVNERFKFAVGEIVAISNYDCKVYRIREISPFDGITSCPAGYSMRCWLSWEAGEPVIDCRFFRGEYVDEYNMSADAIGTYSEVIPRTNYRGADYCLLNAFESCKFRFKDNGEKYEFYDVVSYNGYGICTLTENVKSLLDIGHYSRMAKVKDACEMVTVETRSGEYKDFFSFVTSYHVNDKFTKCGICGKWHLHEESHRLGRTRACDACYNKLKEDGEIEVCSECGCEERAGRMRTYRGRTLCGNCFSNYADNCLNSYGYKPAPVFGYIGNDGEAKYCTRSESLSAIPFGLEWEFNDSDEGTITALELTEAGTIDGNQRAYCKHDGSLATEGVECVFHPMTIDYMEKTDILKKIEVAAIGCDVDSSPEHAGIHFHVPREKLYNFNSADSKIKALGKLDYFFATNKDKVVKFCRRTNLGYCMFPKKLTIDANETAKNIYTRYYEKHSSDRYVAVNNENYNTVEFRIFGSTTNSELVKLYARYTEALIDCVKLMDDDDFLKLEHEDVLSNVISKYYNDDASREKFNKLTSIFMDIV